MNNIVWKPHELLMANAMYKKGSSLRDISKTLKRGYYSVSKELMINNVTGKHKSLSYDRIQNNRKQLLTIKRIVASYYKMNETDIFLKSRKPEILIPRQICQSIELEYTKCSLMFIGSNLGSKDHSTVINSNRKISYLREFDSDFNDLYIKLAKSFTNNKTNRKKNNKNIQNKIDTIKKIRKLLTNINDRIMFNELISNYEKSIQTTQYNK